MRDSSHPDEVEAEKRHREESQRLADIVSFNDERANEAMIASDPTKPDVKDVETEESLRLRGTRFMTKEQFDNAKQR